MSTDTVTLERLIAARPATVFSFFAESDKWLAWMGEDGEFDFRTGGVLRIRVWGEHVAEGRFVEIDRHRRLVFTWGWAEGGLPVPPGSSTVEIVLERVGEGTLLRLAHHGLASPEACTAQAEAWTHYIRRLVTWAEGGDPGADDWV